jgi:electron transfer flavoprotein-quinone oxidoreductase
MGGGFLYTNRDTLSVGLILNLGSMFGRNVYSHDLMEQFKLHPAIAGRLEGAELVEYGAKLISSGWASRPAAFHGDGWMVAGDAAGFVFSNGMVIQGMNYAVRTGIEAAEVADAAIGAKDPSAHRLAEDDRRLEATGVLHDFRDFAGMDRVKWNPRFYSAYPKFATRLMGEVAAAGGDPKRPLWRILQRVRAEAGLPVTGLVRDGIDLVRNF